LQPTLTSSQKKFYIYAIKHVDEGIEILTGVKAGQKKVRSQKGEEEWEEGTINALVDRKLTEYFRLAQVLWIVSIISSRTI
jgi:hypothetical protein